MEAAEPGLVSDDVGAAGVIMGSVLALLANLGLLYPIATKLLGEHTGLNYACIVWAHVHSRHYSLALKGQ